MANHLKKIIPFIIIAILAAGGVELFYRTAFTRLMYISPLQKSQAAVTEVAAPAPSIQKTEPDYQTILNRNLFGPSPEEVQPAITEQAVPEQLAATSLDLGLLGTITGSPNNRRAIILDKKKKVQDIYSQGDVVQGALIKEIQRGKIILSINGKDELLVPEIAKTNPAARTNPAATTTPDIAPQEPPETTAQEPPPPETPASVIEPQPIEAQDK